MVRLMDLLAALVAHLLMDALPDILPWRRVPDVTGQDREAAELLLYSLPLEVVTDRPGDGRVVSQQPPAGTVTRRNRPVTLLLDARESQAPSA